MSEPYEDSTKEKTPAWASPRTDTARVSDDIEESGCQRPTVLLQMPSIGDAETTVDVTKNPG